MTKSVNDSMMTRSH